MRPCCLATDDEWGIYSAGNWWWMGDLFCYSCCRCFVVVVVVLFDVCVGGRVHSVELKSLTDFLQLVTTKKYIYITQRGRESCTKWFIAFYHAVLCVFSFSVPKYLLQIQCHHVLEKNVISAGSTQIKRTVKLKRQTTSKHVWSNRWKRSR